MNAIDDVGKSISSRFGSPFTNILSLIVASLVKLIAADEQFSKWFWIYWDLAVVVRVWLILLWGSLLILILIVLVWNFTKKTGWLMIDLRRKTLVSLEIYRFFVWSKSINILLRYLGTYSYYRCLPWYSIKNMLLSSMTAFASAWNIEVKGQANLCFLLYAHIASVLRITLIKAPWL